MNTSSRARYRWLITAVTLVLPLAALADDPPQRPAVKGKGQARPKAKAARLARAKGDPKRLEALVIARDRKKLSDASLADGEPKTRIASLKPDELLRQIGRPPRKVKTPTFTSTDLDRLLDEQLARSKVAPARPIDDAGFLRRVRYDVTGKPPTADEIVAFERDKDPKKHAKLVDRLLADPGFGHNWARYWRDVIAYHATTTNQRLINYPEFEDWMGEQLNQNRPWDEIARTILTAEGDSHENGATMMLLAHSDQRFQPVEMAGEVSRVFLGIQISCAQCHDHKTDSWKREQFHQFAAFFGGVQVRRQVAAPPIQMKISDRPGRVRYLMPDEKDPQKQHPIEPRFFLTGADAKLPSSLTSSQLRTVAASYITGQDNPWFAKSFVNRVWYALMGESFYPGVDDLGPEREAEASAIIDTLASEWAQGGYDVRWLFQTILKSKAYARQSRSTRSENGRTRFAANCPSRLRADQIVDTLAGALRIPLEQPPLARRGVQSADKDMMAMIGERMRRNGPRARLNGTLGFDPSIASDEVLGTIPQALFFMNDSQLQRAIEARRNTLVGEILTQYPDDRAAVEALYMQVLARHPNADELKTCAAYMLKLGNRREAFEDLLWALVNSTEFITRR